MTRDARAVLTAAVSGPSCTSHTSPDS